MNLSGLKIEYFNLGTKYSHLSRFVSSLLFIITVILFFLAIQDIGFNEPGC
jgi:hypothetical protein